MVLTAQQASKPVRDYEDPATPQTQVNPNQKPTPASQPTVEVITAPPPDTAALGDRKSSYHFKVSGAEWIDTGVTVAAGDHLEFSTDGKMNLSDGREVKADGGSRGWRDLLRQFPVNDVGPGALVGRIGEQGIAVPFSIGSKKAIDVTQTGHLFLAVNLAADLTADGTYQVSMKLASPKAAKVTATPKTMVVVPSLQTLLSPQLFSDIPRQVGDQQGRPGDMVNFALIGTKDQVEKAFQSAGWVTVDRTTADAVVHGLISTLSHDAYVEMPMSTLYLFGRPQDLSFARAAPLEVAAIRHHLRVWETTKVVDGKPLWVGSATHDNGFEKDQRTGGITHHIDPEIDKERDFVEKSFAAAGSVAGAAYVLPDNPLFSAKTATGESYSSDGRIVVMVLK
jgi:LssY-like putative type I secretion system component LssY